MQQLCGTMLLPGPDFALRLVDARTSKEYLMFGVLLNTASY
jgi:hypothetical protein